MDNYHHHHQWLPHQHPQPSYFPIGHLQFYEQNVSGLENKEEVPDDSLYYPPGYRFCPTDEELVSNYLIKHMYDDQEQPIWKSSRKHTIHEVDIYKNSPEVITSEYPLGGVNNEDEWYFITPLSRKYPNGDRPSRTCGDAGFWKPTGKDRRIEVGNIVAGKKCLEFFQGKPPGQKTNWKMHEYRIINEDESAPKNGEKKKELCLALCRIYLNTRKKGKKDEGEEGSEMMNEKEIQSETGSSNSVVEGGDATTNQNQNQMISFDGGDDRLIVDHYLQRPLSSTHDHGAYEPYYYQNGTACCNFNSQELMNHSPFGCVSNLGMAPPGPK